MNKYLIIPLLLFIALFTFNATADVQNAHNQLIADKSADNVKYLDEVIKLITEHFYDKKYLGHDLQKLRNKHKKNVRNAKTSLELHKAVNALIAEFKVSHFAVVEKEVYQGYRNESLNIITSDFGFKLRKLNKKYFATRFVDGGAADESELKYGDQVIKINGKSVEQCKKLFDSGNDVGIPGPEYYTIKAKEDETIQLEVKRKKDSKTQTIKIKATAYNEIKATEKSVKVIEKDGKKIAYMHAWHFLTQRIAKTFHSAIIDDFENCDAMVLDIRGHGGSTLVIQMFLASFTELEEPFRKRIPQWKKPLVVLIDEGTRSAKEIFAHAVQQDELGTLVGRKTQGAVLATHFFKLSDGSALMLPVIDGTRFTKDGKTLEGNGIEPDVVVPLQLEYAAGTDEILERGVKKAVEILNDKTGDKEEKSKDDGESAEEEF